MAHELSITVERDGEHFVESSAEPGKVLEGPFKTEDEALARSIQRSDEYAGDDDQLRLQPEAGEDLGREYTKQAEKNGNDATLQDFMSRMQQQESDEAAPTLDLSAFGTRRAPEDDGPGLARRIAGGAVDVGQDVIKGITEMPVQFVGGVSDFVHNTFTKLDELGNWLNENVADLTFPVPETGIEQIDILIQDPLKAAAGPEERVRPAESVTGGVVREISRFLTGFLPVDKAVKAAGGGRVAAGLTAGFVSDFAGSDEMQAQLGNAWQALGLPDTLLTDWLASDEDDTILEDSFKAAIEGAAIGGLSEGFMLGAGLVRASMRSRRALKEAAADPMAAAREQFGEVGDRDFLILGDPQGPLLTREAERGADKARAGLEITETGVPAEVAARGLTRVQMDEGGDIFVNFAKVDTPDDVQSVIGQMADAFAPQIDEARRGRQTNIETSRLADELGMTPEQLLQRRKGQPLNAEEALAARRLWAASGEKLMEVAELAASGNAGPADLYNFRKMMAIHSAIQTEVIGARTETARALQAWSIPAGGGVEKARSIQLLMESMGGEQVSLEFARRVAALRGQDVSQEALNLVARRGWAATTVDAVKESYVLGLLWSPATHLVNNGSNLLVAGQQIYERGAAARFSAWRGANITDGADAVALGEATAMMYGLISAQKDAFRMGAKALRTGQTGGSLGRIDLPRARTISSETISREMEHSAADAAAFRQSALGKGIDFIGTANRIPGNVLAAGDEFFKTIGYRMEVHAHAFRQATQEGLEGPDLYRRVGQIVNDPPENIRLAAADAALYNTFQNKPGEFVQALMNFRQSGTLNPTFLVLPFVRTPGNILRYTFERSPLAPLVGQWRADIAAGGARADLALARMATGSAIMAVAIDFASSGVITGAGPRDPGKRGALQRQGWQANSILVGDKYYSFKRTDPIGMLFGFAATAAEKVKESDMSPEDFDELDEILASAIAVVSASIVDKTYFTGISEVMTMIEGSEVGEGGVNRFINRQTGSMMPFTTAVSTVKRFVDPVSREISNPWDAIEARMAGWSERLSPIRNLWGKERRPDEVYGRAYDVVAPIRVRRQKISPIDAELTRLQAGPRRIAKRGGTSFEGINVNFRDFPWVYDEYVRLAGNELKHPAWELGAKDYLDAVVSGKHEMSEVYQIFSDGADGGKAAFISNTISEYRKLARENILSDENRERFPDFFAFIEDQKSRQPQTNLAPEVIGE